MEEQLPAVQVLSRKLPIVVVDLLLEYLPFHDLQTLRLVCKTTKEWVETPEVLSHFVVRITGVGRLNEVLSAPEPVPWNNFLFTEPYTCFPSKNIKRFLATYGELVLRLDLNPWWEDNTEEGVGFTVALLSGCPHLESLQSSHLLFCPLESEGSQMNLRLLQNWKNLRHFNVERFLVDPPRPLHEMSFYSQVLSTCTQLKTLTLPHFKDHSARRMESENDENFHRLVFGPVLHVIAQGRLRCLTVPLGSLNFQLLLRLAIACRENGTVLYSPSFPDKFSRRFLESLPTEHLPVLDIIGSLDIVTDTIIGQSLRNVRRISFTGPGFHTFKIENNVYTIPPFPHLNEVRLDFESTNSLDCLENMEVFVHRLAKARRPTVKYLRVAYSQGQENLKYMKINPVDLSASFVNLRVLSVEQWKGKDDEWLQLWSLVGNTLVKLELHNCPTLSDRGILGDDLNQPAFLQLKCLRKLILRNSNEPAGRRNITDLSFSHAFAHMRLQSLHFSEGEYPCLWLSSATLKAMRDRPFGKTIELFFVQGTNLILHRIGEEIMFREVCYSEASTLTREHSQFDRSRNGCCSIV